uniref:Putative secreted protein n=1 Tax=Anopheles darlingi TaxID=43151 RepID=A0A2M4D4D9_ANODA
MIFRLLARSMFFTHLFACPSGSIISGQRRACFTMIPFSTEKLSVGRPQFDQLRICSGLPRVVRREKFSVQGMRSSSASRFHPCTIVERNSVEKHPR